LLHFARRGNASAIGWLLAHGIARDTKDAHGRTAAELARGHPAVLHALAR
jgi:hypothetical protein